MTLGHLHRTLGLVFQVSVVENKEGSTLSWFNRHTIVTNTHWNIAVTQVKCDRVTNCIPRNSHQYVNQMSLKAMQCSFTWFQINTIK